MRKVSQPTPWLDRLHSQLSSFFWGEGGVLLLLLSTVELVILRKLRKVIDNPLLSDRPEIALPDGWALFIMNELTLQRQFSTKDGFGDGNMHLKTIDTAGKTVHIPSETGLQTCHSPCFTILENDGIRYALQNYVP